MRTDNSQDEQVPMHLESDAQSLAGAHFPDALGPLHPFDSETWVAWIIYQQTKGFLDTFSLRCAQGSEGASKTFGEL